MRCCGYAHTCTVSMACGAFNFALAAGYLMKRRGFACANNVSVGLIYRITAAAAFIMNISALYITEAVAG